MLHVFSDAERKQITTLLELALAEDCVGQDLTSRAIFPPEAETTLRLTARQDMVFAGAAVILEWLDGRFSTESNASAESSPPLAPPASGVSKNLAPVSGVGKNIVSLANAVSNNINIILDVKDGDSLKKGDTIGTIAGSTLNILAHERVVLNLLQRLCGVASLTRAYVEQVKHTKARVLDTRKTMPGWRALDKYAVRCGGGLNHRMNLADMVMIKDNHIAAAGSLERAVKRVLHYQEAGIPIVVECDNLTQLAECLNYPVNRILLDNMSLDMLKQAVEMTAGKLPLEASGGVNVNTIRAVAETAVDYISVGAITHAAVFADIGLDAI